MMASVARSAAQRRPALVRAEMANSVTHGVGLGLAIAALVALVTLATGRSWLHLVAGAVYGVTLVALYLTSTLFHCVRGDEWPRLKQALLVADHVAVYLLIAGTYTPFALLSLEGATGRRLLVLIWSVALVGIAVKVWLGDRYRVASVIVYLAMGWLFLPLVGTLLERIGWEGLAWVLAGAAAYCAGIVFYLWPAFRHHHAVWHLFVVLGSACHFVAVVLYVFPGRPAP